MEGEQEPTVKEEQEGDWGLEIGGRGWHTGRDTRRERSEVMEDILYTELQRVNCERLRCVYIVLGIFTYGVLHR